MTETEWLATDDIGRMERFIAGRMSRRKECLWHHAGYCQIALQFQARLQYVRPMDRPMGLNPQTLVSQQMSGPLEVGRDVLRLFWPANEQLPEEIALRLKEALTRVVRCIYGNPFRPVNLASGCVTATVRALAEAIYVGREKKGAELDPDRLAVLADACEEAGLPAELLAHLRGPGPHVRGCCVVDAVLGLG